MFSFFWTSLYILAEEPLLLIIWQLSHVCFFSAEEMLRTKDYFKNGQLDKEGLVKFIKDVKKNTKLSDEDAAILAASKFVLFFLF